MWELFIALFWSLLLLTDWGTGKIRWIKNYNKSLEKEEMAKPFLEKYEITEEEYKAEKDPVVWNEVKQELEEFFGLPYRKCIPYFFDAFYFARFGKIPPLTTVFQCRYQLVRNSSNIKLLKWYEKVLKEHGMSEPLVYTFAHLSDNGITFSYEGRIGYVRDLPDDYRSPKDAIFTTYWEPVEYLICNSQRR